MSILLSGPLRSGRGGFSRSAWPRLSTLIIVVAVATVSERLGLDLRFTCW